MWKIFRRRTVPPSRASNVMVILILWFGTAASLQAETTEQRIVAVHPGTELLHIVNYLSGIAPPKVESYSYRDDVDAWFADFQSHPAVEHAKGLPYNDFVELGWAFDKQTLALTLPEGYGWQGKLKDPEFLTTYLELAEQFAKESDFALFFESQQENYQRWSQQFESRLSELDPEALMWDFFAATDNSATKDTVIYYSISPLGVTLRANMIMHEVNPKRAHYGVVLVPFDPFFLDGDDYDEPYFNYTDIALQHAVWHEAAHLVYEALATKYIDELSAITYRDCFSRLLAPFDDDRLNTYFYIHEVVADTVSIFLKSEYVSEEAAQNHILLNENIGGMLYRPLYEHFRDDYFVNRHDVSFQQHIPALIEFINSVPSVDQCN